MTSSPLLEGTDSLDQLKILLPLAYANKTVGDVEFFTGALAKAQTFDPSFNVTDIHAACGIDVDTGKSNVSVAAAPIETINKNYAWIEANASIYRLEYGDFINPANFKTQFDNQTVSIQTGSRTNSVGAGTAWLKSPARRQHVRLVIRPGAGEITADNCLNEWRGFTVVAAAGNVDPFLNLLSRLVPESEPCKYVLQWLAHLIQHPDIKMHVSLALWSQAQGVGKNLLFECTTSLIGAAHSTVIGQAELGGIFNGWANRKVLVIGDEVSNTDRRQDTDKLKGLVTGSTVYINEKYQPAREIPNLLNFIFLSNHNDALFVDDQDRRYFVWEITAARLPDSIVKEFVAWRNNGGLAALLYFLQTYDIKGYNPKAHAPMTDAKLQMVQDNRSDLETWLVDLMASNVAEVVGREVVTAHELAKRYDHDTSRRNTSAKAITGACKRLGAYARANQVRLTNGKKVRAMAIARTDYWSKQPEAEWSAEMTKPMKW